MSANVINVTDVDFNEKVIKSSIPVLVDFWATWCGPCQMMHPVIDKLADLYDGKVLFCKVDVDLSPETPGKYNIVGVPTMFLFQDGQIKEQFVGMRSLKDLQTAIDRVLA